MSDHSANSGIVHTGRSLAPLAALYGLNAFVYDVAASWYLCKGRDS